MVLDQHRNEILNLCEQFNVKSLYVFGSVLSDQFRPESDIDFVIDFDVDDPITYGENYFQVKFALQHILKRPIDLLEQKSLRNSFLIDRINKTKQVVYES